MFGAGELARVRFPIQISAIMAYVIFPCVPNIVPGVPDSDVLSTGFTSGIGRFSVIRRNLNAGTGSTFSKL